VATITDCINSAETSVVTEAEPGKSAAVAVRVTPPTTALRIGDPQPGQGFRSSLERS
jgi:hypothetical protein